MGLLCDPKTGRKLLLGQKHSEFQKDFFFLYWIETPKCVTIVSLMHPFFIANFNDITHVHERHGDMDKMVSGQNGTQPYRGPRCLKFG